MARIAGRRPPAELAGVLAELLGAEPGDLIAVAVLAAGSPRAREDMPASVQPHATNGGRADLTEKERAVAVLAGQALTNRQIARRLFISPHTVSYHLRQVFRKLGIDSRVHLARLVRE